MIVAANPVLDVPIDPLDHQALVIAIARRHRGRGLDFEDLVQEGQVGLLWACARFDPGRVAWSTCAYSWISRAMCLGIARMAGPLREPMHARRLIAMHERGELDLDDLRPRQRLAVVQALRRRRAGDVGDHQLEDGNLGGIVPDHREAGPVDRAIGAEEAGRLGDAIGRLGARTAEVVGRHNGLGGRPPETLDQIGADLGVTRERVRQIEARAIRRVGEILRVPDPATGTAGTTTTPGAPPCP